MSSAPPATLPMTANPPSPAVPSPAVPLPASLSVELLRHLIVKTPQQLNSQQGNEAGNE